MAKKPGTIWMMVLVGWLCLTGMPTGAVRAQGVPAAIKYQAVLRDVEGEPMADRGGLAVRITLRQGSPAGSILYQETHDRLTTDAFGLLQLEIGRGTVSPAGLATLSDIPWENSPIYAEIEVQSDDNGYTTMGASELLSVPYALYAGNASVGFGLTDGVLPKYDAGYLNLVDSKLSETLGGELQFYNGENAYRFPVRRGTKNQSLTLIDDEGTLGWRTGGGGGGAECDGCRDGYMTYWDDVAGQLHTTDMQYDEQTGTVYAGAQFVSPNVLIVENEMEINGTVSGNHNLQYNNPGTNSVWVGNSRNGSDAYRLAGDGVTIDSLNKTLRFGGGASVWGFQPEGTVDHIYTKLNPGQSVHVGIGVERPKTRLHMQDGALLLSGTVGGDGAPGEWTAGNHLYWHAGKGALRMGKFDQDQSGLWSTVNLGDNSIALGTNAEAMLADNVAIGANAKAQGTHTMVFGQNAVAQGDRGLSMGYNVKVSGERAVGIGSGYSENINSPTFNVEGARSVGIGYDVRNLADDAVAVGQGIAMEKRAGNSVVLGSELTVADELGVTIGCEIKENNSYNYGGNIQMGSKLNLIESSAVINIGASNAVDHCQAGVVCIGGDLVTNNLGPAINIGFANKLPLTGGSPPLAGPTVIGCNLTYNEEDGIVLGKYNNETLEFWDVPALVVGVGTSRGRKNALELSEEGELHLLGREQTIYAHVQNPSDLNLKTDIQPLGADVTVLQALQPVRYRFKADKDGLLQFGFIAQDVERYFPHLVKTNAKGLKSLNYIGLLPVLWQYTQQLERTVDAQAAEIERLQSELETLKADMRAVKAALGLTE